MQNKIRNIDIDINQIKILSFLIREKFHIISTVKFEVKKDKDKSYQIYNSINTLYVSLDRLENTSLYLNSLQLGKIEYGHAFDFYNFINNAYIIIECIKHIANLFKVDMKELNESKEFFKDIIQNKDYTDNHFFRYLRSVTSVHPIQTDRYSNIHGPSFIDSSIFAVWSDITNEEEAYIYIRVYKSKNLEKDIEEDDITTHDIKLNIYLLHYYVYSYIDFIEVIIEKILDYIERKEKTLATTKLKKINNFNSYDEYLKYLEEQFYIRYSIIYKSDIPYIAYLLKINVQNIENKKKVELFINALKYLVSFIHNELETLKNSNETTLLQDGLLKINIEDNYYLSTHIYELISDERNDDDTIKKMVYRNLKSKMEKYFVITEKENPEELFLLILCTFYFSNLEINTYINDKIPNTLEYRLRLKNKKI